MLDRGIELWALLLDWDGRPQLEHRHMAAVVPDNLFDGVELRDLLVRSPVSRRPSWEELIGSAILACPIDGWPFALPRWDRALSTRRRHRTCR